MHSIARLLCLEAHTGPRKCGRVIDALVKHFDLIRQEVAEATYKSCRFWLRTSLLPFQHAALNRAPHRALSFAGVSFSALEMRHQSLAISSMPTNLRPLMNLSPPHSGRKAFKNHLRSPRIGMKLCQSEERTKRNLII